MSGSVSDSADNSAAGTLSPPSAARIVTVPVAGSSIVRNHCSIRHLSKSSQSQFLPLVSQVDNELPSQMVSYSSSALGDSKPIKGNVKLVISEVSQLRHKMTTSIHHYGNMHWRLACKTECSKRTNNVKHFSVYVDCNADWESTLWSCDALVEFKLHSQVESQPHFVRQFTNKFSYKSNNWGFPSFYEWTELLNAERGFVKHDRLIIEAIIHIQKTRGIRRSPRFDFTAPHPTNSNVVLLIDGVRLHVSKDYLSLYSPVFQSLFYGDWREKGQGEVPIEDVILDEFVELLHVLYPSHKPITSENVEYLLELSDKFEINHVMEKCEEFLIRTDDINSMTKLLWADQYNLARLQDITIRTFKTPLEIKALWTNEEFKNLSDTTKAALLEKIFKLL